VVDSSIFPSSSSVNPALTIMANALRVGDQLKDRLGSTTVEADASMEAPARQPAAAR
jgi:choline dehydrogenase-like flavoprotein